MTQALKKDGTVFAAKFRQAISMITPLDEAGRAAALADIALSNPALAAEVQFYLNAQVARTGLVGENDRVSRLRVLANSGPPTLEVGQTIGDFKIVRELGAGAFATVYLAHQISLDRLVALKVSETHGAEARTMANLEHDHIVSVFSEHIENNLRLLCIQYVPGKTLEDVMKGIPWNSKDGKTFLDACVNSAEQTGTIDPKAIALKEKLLHFDFTETCLWMGARLAEALAHAHARDVLHLDVKPANVLITPFGRPLLLDFNVSMDMRDWENIDPNALGGTPEYMPPEQAALFTAPKDELEEVMDNIDFRVDIYALGLVIKEVLQHAKAVHPLLQQSIEAVIEKATHSDKAVRYANATEFAEALDGCIEYSQVLKSLPHGTFMDVMEKFPLQTITFVAVSSQVFGSVVNTLYNVTQVVTVLSPVQQSFFGTLVVTVIPAVYVPLVALWVRALARLSPRTVKDAKNALTMEELKVFRKRSLALPKLLFVLSFVGWAVCAVVMPYLLHKYAGPVPRSTFIHFTFGYLMSWLVCLAYGYSSVQYVCLRLLYPRYWQGVAKLRTVASSELPVIGGLQRFWHSMSGLSPSVAALLMLLMGAHSGERGFTAVLSVLIVFGMTGTLFSQWCLQKLINTFAALRKP